MIKILRLPRIFQHYALFSFSLVVGMMNQKARKQKISKFQFTTKRSKPATIKGTNITYTFPYGTNVTNLKADVTKSAKATISPKPEEARSYANPVKFTVTAEDRKIKQEYTVTVSKEKAKGEIKHYLKR